MKGPGVTDTDLRLAAALLRLAGDRFANHGCNDFDVSTEAGLTAGESAALWKAIAVWSGDEDMDCAGPIHDDWVLMQFLAERLDPG